MVNGPWVGVVTSDDPFDSGDDTLIDATNVYIPDVQSKSGVYARPGMELLNNGAAVTTSATTFRGQGAINHTDLALVTTNFVVFNGELWRANAQFTSFTNVTPVGITIDPGVDTRVYGTSFGDTLAITDGVNRPWLATNLSATPITGTYIDYDSGGTTWAVNGPMRLYGGSFMAALKQVNNVDRRTDFSWSLPGDASAGWQQTNYDFNWTLGQTDASPLTAIYGTNTALIYWRGDSMGALSGIPGPNFQGSHTDDNISKNIGTLAPQSIVGYGSIIYFTDNIGRPYRWQPGSDPEPIWLQMRGIVSDSSVGFSGVTKNVTTASYEATMNVYIVAVWSPLPDQQCPAVEGYIFDVRTGRYFGRFKISVGVQIETLGFFPDSQGRNVMVALGSIAAPTDSSLATSGYVWGIKSLEAIGNFVTTEAGVFLTTEDGSFVITEGTDASNWLDNEDVPTISVTTPRFGYEINKVLTVDRAAVLTAGGAPCSVSMSTAAIAETVEGTPTPSTTQDGIGKITIGSSGIQGRGVTMVVSPTTATTQWQIQQVSVDAVINNANPDEV